MRVLVCGGRDYTAVDTVWAALSWLKPTEICHGGASGADELAGRWALAHSIPAQVFKASWEEHGNAAGRIRNELMLRAFEPDIVVAFPGGRGTGHMIRTATKYGKIVFRVEAQ